MKVIYVGKNVDLRDNFKEEAGKKLSRLEKYFQDDAVETTVTCSVEGDSQHRVEITIRVIGAHGIFRADQSTENMLDSVDRCIDSLISQIRKNKTKLLNQRHAKESIRFEAIEDVESEKEDQDPIIGRVKELELHPMSPEEACLQMDLIDHDFFLFRNIENNEVNVVYKRKAGNCGLLMPEE